MNVKDFLKKWYDKEITDWGASTTPEYAGWKTEFEYTDFQRNYRSVLKEMGKEIGFELHLFNKNHYEFSAVMKSNKTNQFYYISISDVRYFKNEWANNILYRTMEHDHDWTGGSNRYSKLENLTENLLNLDKQILRNLEIENARQVINHSEPQKSNTEDFEMKLA